MRDGMSKSRLSKVKQDHLIEYFVAGTIARCTAALVGINRKTAAYYFHRLRAAIAYHLEPDGEMVVGGEIKWMNPILVASAKECGAVVLREKSRFSVCWIMVEGSTRRSFRIPAPRP